MWSYGLNEMKWIRYFTVDEVRTVKSITLPLNLSMSAVGGGLRLPHAQSLYQSSSLRARAVTDGHRPGTGGG